MYNLEDIEYEEFIKIEKMASRYNYRNGKKNDDGSMGEVKISPLQFKNILLEAYIAGKDYEGLL